MMPSDAMKIFSEALDKHRAELATKDATIAGLEAENTRLREALASAAMRLKAVHDDAFKQAGGHGLKTSDGRDFSCMELNLCWKEATAARAALEAPDER